MSSKWTYLNESSACPPAKLPVLIVARSMLGNPIYEIASYEEGVWTLLEDNSQIDCGWVQAWRLVPALQVDETPTVTSELVAVYS